MPERIRFWDLCQLFLHVQKEKGQRKGFILAKYLQAWRTITEDLFPVIRLILPKEDRERPPYRRKEDKLGKLWLDATGISRTSSDGQALLKWKSPGLNKKASSVGDFSGIIFDLVSKRAEVLEPSTLTVEDINASLDILSQTDEEGGPNREEEVIRSFFRQCSAEEQRWLVRIILKDISVGINTKTVLNAYHPDAYDAYTVNGDLAKVVRDLRDVTLRLTNKDRVIMPFNRFTPMLAYFETVDDMAESFEDALFLETKYDGERIQLHKRGDRYEYYTRKGQSRTVEYGSGPQQPGSLTPRIHTLFHQRIDNVVLDGEMMAYDPILGGFLPFGSVYDASRSDANSSRGSSEERLKGWR